MTFSVLLFCTKDNFFLEKYLLIKEACRDLQENLENKKIHSEILFFDYFEEEKTKININDLFNLKSKFTKIKYNFLKFEKNKNYKTEIIPKQFKQAVLESNYEFILLKSIDTFFDDNLYNFLGKTKLNKNYYYNAFRYDYDFTKEIKNYLKFTKENKNNFTINPLSCDYKFNYFMELHTNAVGDFILTSKQSIINANYIPSKLYNDLLLIYKLHSHGLKQYIVKDGGVFKFLNTSAWKKNIRTKDLTKFQIKFEKFLYKYFTSKEVNLIRGIFNYPKQIYKDKIISSYERLVILKIFLNKIIKIPLY